MRLSKESKTQIQDSHNRTGWINLTNQLLEELEALLEKAKDKTINITYGKEKYGHLEFEFKSNDYNMFYDFFVSFEDRFECTCAVCGKPGEMRDDSLWIIPLCDDCYNIRKNISFNNSTFEELFHKEIANITPQELYNDIEDYCIYLDQNKKNSIKRNKNIKEKIIALIDDNKITESQCILIYRFLYKISEIIKYRIFNHSN